MTFKEYHNLKEVLKDMPDKGAVGGDKHSIPDVYGRAIQFYIAMEKAYDEKEITEEVKLWRGLISLIALKNYLQFPIMWEHVELADRNSILKNSLRYVPHISIFNSSEMDWDGRNFYVLKWIQTSGEAGKDIFLYSPSTLIYPVADIYTVLTELDGLEWFDNGNRKILEVESVLSEPQKKVVFFWLNGIWKALNNGVQLENKPNAVILYHLKIFMDDLGIKLNANEEEFFETEKINDSVFDRLGLAAWLNKTIDIKITQTGSAFGNKELFSDQLLYFEVDNGLNPFIECKYAEAYRIKGENNWYAFLPISSMMRAVCVEQPIAKCISMKHEKNQKEEFIHVHASLSDIHPSWPDQERKYRICKENENTFLKNIAMKYTGQNFPLIAVWPGNICNAWKKYYLMLDEDDANGMISIDDELVEEGENPYVKLVPYVPEVIPLIRKKNRESEPFTIGIVTPKRVDDPPENRAVVCARVGVDFGTSSTKVYAKIDGQEDKIEILIAEDKPFVITKGSAKSVDFMKDYFIAAEDVSKDLFSVYRRSKPEILSSVEPILDGVIYQSRKNENLEQDLCFMPDLKWEVLNYRQYYKAFIEQLCLHTSILLLERYGVNNIIWTYAIPKSMPDENKEIMMGMWNTYMKAYLDSISDKITHTIADNYMTESEAASRYFLFDRENMRVNASKGFLVVDIGGGSSDLALWQEVEGTVSLKWHSSINVAGRKMFTKWIENYLGNWSGLVGPDGSLQSMLDYALTDEMSPAIKTAFVERILNSYYIELIQIYLNGCENGAHDGWELKLRSKVTQAFSVFMFALGYQIGSLMRNNVLSASTDGGNFIIALGGRGSKMIDWTDHGLRDAKLLEFYKAGIGAAGIELNMPLMVQRSKMPKTEVAKGLLENAESIDDGVNVQLSHIHRNAIEEEAFMQALDILENTYATVYPTNSRSLEPLIFDRNQVANLLSLYKNKECECLEVFMDVLYCRYILNAE